MFRRESACMQSGNAEALAVLLKAGRWTFPLQLIHGFENRNIQL